MLWQELAVKCRKTIVVLGVPRSGTSMVAGMLRSLGIFMGENVKPRTHEDLEILWRPRKEIEGVVLRRNESREVWGWKDPHAARYIREIVDSLVSPMFIRVNRKPSDCARSDCRRNRRATMAVATERNRRYSKVYAKSESWGPTLRVQYERAIADPSVAAARIAEFCGEPFSEESVASAAAFVQPGDYRPLEIRE